MDQLALILRSTLGDSKTQLFIQVLNRESHHRRRLLFWQEQALAKIAESHPEYAALTYEEVWKRLSICHVHGMPLEPGRMEIATWRDVRSQAFFNRAATQFPYANMVRYRHDNEIIRPADLETTYCPACRVALIEWNRGRQRKVALPDRFVMPLLKNDPCTTPVLAEINDSEFARLKSIVESHPRLSGYYLFSLVSILRFRVDGLSQEIILEKVIDHFDDDPTLPDPDFVPDHEWTDYETSFERAREHAIESLVGGGAIGHTRETMPMAIATDLFERLVALCGNSPQFYFRLGLGERGYAFQHGVLIVAEHRAGILAIVEDD